MKHCIKIAWLQATSRRRTKSFSVQQFFKNSAEVWASSPHLRSKLKLHRETKQKSKRKSEESQLPLKSKGCNEIQGFRGNCDSQGKLGMCPSLAEPVSGGFSRSNSECFTWNIASKSHDCKQRAAGEQKVFRCSSFSKILPRCGRVAHICEANWNCTVKQNKNLRENRKNRNCL